MNTIPIDLSHLKAIKFGMIWYIDDTVSQEFYPDKTVKSVVLGIDIENGIIYGDTFIDKREISKQQVDSFLDEYSRIKLFSEPEFSGITDKIAELNEILKKIGKPTWQGKTYWCSGRILYDGSMMAHYLPGHTQVIVDVEEYHDFHPIYEYQVPH